MFGGIKSRLNTRQGWYRAVSIAVLVVLRSLYTGTSMLVVYLLADRRTVKTMVTDSDGLMAI